MSERRVDLSRETKETKVRLSLDLDGSGKAEIATGIGFYDHMLTALARHARFDLEIECRGDLEIDAHHSVEDVGIVLGDALDRALGEKRGITRFGHAYAPLDEALARAVVDLCGRAYLHYALPFETERIGTMPTELFEDFFRALTDRGRLNLHLDLIRGRNSHHVAEAAFKATALALRRAVAIDPRTADVPSTKGSLG